MPMVVVQGCVNLKLSIHWYSRTLPDPNEFASRPKQHNYWTGFEYERRVAARLRRQPAAISACRVDRPSSSGPNNRGRFATPSI
jgi:hypothetical protein